jgi:hypothetical protein
VRWATKMYGAHLRDRVCAEKLNGAMAFTAIEAADPILSGLEHTRPCDRRGPLSIEYWTQLPRIVWQYSFGVV